MAQESENGQLQSTLAAALQAESDQLRTERKELTLFSGEYLGAFAEHFYYRFEIPEEIYLNEIERASFIFSQLQSVTINGWIVAQHNQYLTIALPIDFGQLLPEIRCVWNHEDHLKPIIEKLKSATVSQTVASFLFQPAAPDNHFPATFQPAATPITPPEQQEALQKIFKHRVSYVWGMIRSGKTHVLAVAALNYLKAGKRVLFVSPTSETVDQMILRVVTESKNLDFVKPELFTRVGYPVNYQLEELTKICLDSEIGTKKSEKKKVFQERVTLLQKFWKTKIQQFLYEDYYAKLQDFRDRSNENKKLVEKLQEEISGHKDTITRAQNASMLEKLKKSYKEELANAQKQFAEKQASLKKQQLMQQTLTKELVKLEAQTPIPSEEIREFNAALKRINELGGIQKVGNSIEEFIAIDEIALLQSKRFVASTVSTALSDPRMHNMQFDLVIVDDAETIQMPSLAALSMIAQDRMVVAGDPFQLGPESFSNSDLAQTWLQQDIFLHVSGTDKLQKLFDWAQQNSQWCIFLASHFATTPKLSLFVSSVLFDDKINVFVSPHAKGKIYFIDTSEIGHNCKQYIGRKKIIPFNEVQMKRSVEFTKHALMIPQRVAADVGIIVPFSGSTLFAKLQLRLNGLRNVEVGTPQSFRNRRKKAVIFDTTVAGLDYTLRQIDDRKVGEHRLARILNSVFSCVEEDLYIVANLSHFKNIYKDRLLTRMLLLLQAQADPNPIFTDASKQFDGIDWDKRLAILEGTRSATRGKATEDSVLQEPAPPAKVDAELAMKMKMMAKQQPAKPQQTGRNFERETYFAVYRVLGMKKDVNLLSQTIGGDLLFRHSLLTELAIARLPMDNCQNEDEFRKIMEKWNLLIFEMSGGNKTDLSFFAKNAPETRVRWDINSLKAFYSSDVEAAIEEGKHKIATSVSKVFQECLGKSQPANPTEWSTAYLNFLAKMESYLGWISEQLRK
ncbi:MAG: AAA domain-containing protein [bacterium]